MRVRAITFLMSVVLLAACSQQETLPSGPNILSGKRFTGNFTSTDHRCVTTGCKTVVELIFDDQGMVSVRYLEDAQMTPGDLLLARGVVHHGFHPTSIQGSDVRFTKERHAYTLTTYGGCLKGTMRHRVNNLTFDVYACETS